VVTSKVTNHKDVNSFKLYVDPDVSLKLVPAMAVSKVGKEKTIQNNRVVLGDLNKPVSSHKRPRGDEGYDGHTAFNAKRSGFKNVVASSQSSSSGFICPGALLTSSSDSSDEEENEVVIINNVKYVKSK
jgi:hypothetical protein